MGVASAGWVRRSVARARRFLDDDVWQEPAALVPRRRLVLQRGARVLYVAFRALFLEDTLHVRAAALTYFTVLSLVPLLAFAFAVLKGFGAYDALIEHTIRPYLLDTFATNPALHRAVEQLLNFVTATSVASLGMLGLLTLLYAATRLLRNVEIALNEIWGAGEARNHLQQLRDYVAIIVVTPICTLAAFALATLGQLVETIRFVEDKLGLGGAVDWLLGSLGPFCVILVGLIFLYMVMPNTKVRPRSALVGALIGATLWCLVLIMHVRFQVGVARFNALYSGFAAIPIFLVWLQLSWLVILVGAQAAAADQNTRAAALRARLVAADQSYKELLCVSALLRIAQAFVAGDPPLSLLELSAATRADAGLLRVLLTPLCRAGIIVASDADDRPIYTLARAPDRLRLQQILDVLRYPRANERADVASVPGIVPEAVSYWRELDRACEGLPQNRSLLEMIGSVEQVSGIQQNPRRAGHG
jgi:membrane protein